MSYFKQVDDYQTYRGNKHDFHFEYNVTSGGGQSFLGGHYIDNDGMRHYSGELNSKQAIFLLRFRDVDGKDREVNLGKCEGYQYPITPRGKNSNNVKFSLGKERIRPSLLLPAVMMLPKTTTVNMANSLEVSPLTTENYWLRSMWLDCEPETEDIVHFIPKDFIFSGGRSKQGEYSTEEGKPTGELMFFELDYSKRLCDIIYASANCGALSQSMAEILHFFRNILVGEEQFDYEKCYTKTAKLMCLTAHSYPTIYSGIGDPLPTIMEAVRQPVFSVGSMKQIPSNVTEPHNLIFFGAPGTGKSYELNRLAIGTDDEPGYFDEDNVTRVTFHPDYTYAQFVGCFKPYSKIKKLSDDESAGKSEEEITYRFVAGPFIETYKKAVQNPNVNYLLIIEEINRANTAAVFGDIFQLLDRNAEGLSEYRVATPKEMHDHLEASLTEYANAAHVDNLADALPKQEYLKKECEWLCSPPNMYIWATMNSADQGVFPMDTAFKRRWDFRYMGINDGSTKLEEIAVPVGEPRRLVKWDDLRRGINKVLLDAGVNEDKLIGPFFISPTRLKDASHFTQIFMDKVLLYLFEDAAKIKKPDVFSLGSNATYSEICADFKKRGELAFNGMELLDPFVDEQQEETVEPSGADGEG